MNKLHILPSDISPEIIINPEESSFVIKGKSVPENSFEFYKPVLEYIATAIEQNIAIKDIEIDLDYFNSNSSKILLDILLKLSVTDQVEYVAWYIKQNDDEMKEAAEDYMAILGMEFNIIVK